MSKEVEKAGKKVQDAVVAHTKATAEYAKLNANLSKCQSQLKSGDPATLGIASAELAKLVPKLVPAMKKVEDSRKKMEAANGELQKLTK